MKKKLLTMFLAASVLLTAALNFFGIQHAEAEVRYSNLVVAEGVDTKLVLTPGVTTKVVVPVKSVQEVIYEPRFEAILPEDAPFEVLDFYVYQDIKGFISDYGYIGTAGNAMLCFSVVTKETAKIGNYDFQVRYEEWGRSDGVISEGDREYSQSITFTGIVREEMIPPEFAVSDMKEIGRASCRERV